MNLRDHMSDSLDAHPHAEPDLARLTTGARRDGRRRVRRRRTAIGAAAVVLLGGIGGGVVAQVTGDDRRTESVVATDPTTGPAPSTDPAPTSVAPSASDPGEPVGTTTGRSAVAGLIQGLNTFPGRDFSDFSGSDPSPGYSGALTYTEDGGRTRVRVEVELDASAQSCAGDEIECTIEDEPELGQVLRSEMDVVDAPAGVLQRTVSLLRPDGIRTTVTAINAVPAAGGGLEQSRDVPSLDYDDLVDVVRQDYWGADMPIALVRDGEALEPYRSE